MEPVTEPLTWNDVIAIALMCGTLAVFVLAVLAVVFFVGFLAVGGYSRREREGRHMHTPRP